MLASGIDLVQTSKVLPGNLQCTYVKYSGYQMMLCYQKHSNLIYNIMNTY